jgi:drug/metabolite transporter (DMT)-like permease
MTHPQSPQQTAAERDWRADPPPFPWLDDPGRWQGPMPPGLAIICGLGLALVGLFAVTLGLVEDDQARVARIASGAPIAAIGAFIVHMGTARRAWRRRHPGADPAVVAAELNANVGDRLGNNSVAARIGRWVLVLVCAVFAFVCGVAVVEAATGAYSAGSGATVVIALLGLLAVFLGAMTVRRIRRGRR